MRIDEVQQLAGELLRAYAQVGAEIFKDLVAGGGEVGEVGGRGEIWGEEIAAGKGCWEWESVFDG